MNGNFALDYTSLGKPVINVSKPCQKSVKDCVGDAFIAAQEAGFDNLREIIDGRLCGIEALISHMREAIFPSTEYEPERLFCQLCRSE